MESEFPILYYLIEGSHIDMTSLSIILKLLIYRRILTKNIDKNYLGIRILRPGNRNDSSQFFC